MFPDEIHTVTCFVENLIWRWKPAVAFAVAMPRPGIAHRDRAIPKSPESETQVCILRVQKELLVEPSHLPDGVGPQKNGASVQVLRVA
jgi:hypothetical protein